LIEPSLTSTPQYISYLISCAIYNLYFHPLAKFPGSKLWAISRIPFISVMLGGSLPFRVKSLHDEYGSIVRVASDELSFIDPRAWKYIYLRKDFVRPQIWGSRPPGVEAHNFISASVSDHARFRRAFQSAFSEKATQQHETTVNKYMGVLINRLKEATKKQSEEKPGRIDLVQWINLTVFDVIGDFG
jgi:hypothetical protein